jgi:hypothetical protein
MSTPRNPRPPTPQRTPQGPAPLRELIAVARPDAGLRAGGSTLAAADGTSVDGLALALSAAGATIQPLFGPSEERVRSATASAAADATGEELPDLSRFYSVKAPDARLDELARTLSEHDAIETAYVKPAPVPAVLNDMAPTGGEAPPVTPLFTARQGYLNAAPAGIDALHAWTVPGGSGAGVRVIDIEGAWRFTHEDLVMNQGGVVGGTPIADLGWRNHGTAVLGEFGGDRNSFGVTGICPDAVAFAISFTPDGTAAAITAAANRLSPGDIILIELQRTGPAGRFIPLEWWPDDYAAIRYATSVRGVIVVEAAGNGAEDLANPVYDANPGGFPSTWRNPFRRNPADSGAVLVGAGAPPPGTHGRDWGPDRSRLDFSNFGPNVDVQGWGREVTTCGYGDLQTGASEDVWYTDQFSGTSSASPIVVGAVGATQGALRAAGKPLLTPATARSILRGTGSPQQDAVGRPATQRIGNRPNLRQIFATLGIGAGIQAVPLYRYWNAGIGDHFYTTDWSELGSGRHGWAYEGIQCHVSPQRVTGFIPLYRYWNPTIGDHFYTTSWAELGSGRYGWAFERIQCYVTASRLSGTVPLYRYWNAGIGDHFYTTSWAELGSGRYGWAFEGIQCYVYPSQVTLAPQAAAPEAAGEMPAEALEVGEPVESGISAGLPGTFRIGVAQEVEEEAGEPAFAVTAEGEPAPDQRSFTVPFPAGFHKKGERPGGRSRPVTVSFTVGDDEG